MWWLLVPGLNIKRYLGMVGLGFLGIGVGIGTALGAAWWRPHTGWPLVLWIGAGLALAGTGAFYLRRTVNEAMGSGRWTERIASRILTRGPRIVAIGGGTGLPSVLRGLKAYTTHLTAIVTVADDGGSSGRLRGDLGILPPGDIRNCMVALADTEPSMESLFQFRFLEGELAGHNLGNLFLAAMEQIQGDFVSALAELSRVLALRGRVLPATLEQVTLHAELASGTVVQGESNIGRSREPIRRVWLDPPDATPLAEAIQAIMEADLVVVGPGSLYTSVLPNLLIRPIQEAVRQTPALRVYVANAMTQPGETAHFGLAEHLRAISQHVGEGFFDVVVANDEQVPGELRQKYLAEGAEPVQVRALDARWPPLVTAPLLDFSHPDGVVRHDSEKLSRTLLRLLLKVRPERWEGRVMDALWLESRLKEREQREMGGGLAPFPPRRRRPRYPIPPESEVDKSAVDPPGRTPVN